MRNGRPLRNGAGRDGADGVRLRGFDRSLPMALLRAREAVMRRFRASLREHGITEQQWRVLRALASVGQMEILELADVTFLLPPSLSRILRDLDKRKLILRRAAPDDLRRGLVSIAPRGVTLIERVGVESEAIYGEITGQFGAANLRALHDLLARLETALTVPDVAVPARGKAKGVPARSRAGP